MCFNVFQAFASIFRKDLVRILEWVPRLAGLQSMPPGEAWATRLSHFTLEAWSEEEEAQLLEIWQILTKDSNFIQFDSISLNFIQFYSSLFKFIHVYSCLFNSN